MKRHYFGSLFYIQEKRFEKINDFSKGLLQIIVEI